MGEHVASTIDALELDEFHLVVHDIGGPIGFEVTARMPDRVQSLTVLNTITDPASFTKPPPMRPFEYRGIGEAWLKCDVPTRLPVPDATHRFGARFGRDQR